MAEEQNDTTAKGVGPWDPNLAALLSSVVMTLKQQNDTPGIPKVAITGKTAIAYMVAQQKKEYTKVLDQGFTRIQRKVKTIVDSLKVKEEAEALRRSFGKNNEDASRKIGGDDSGFSAERSAKIVESGLQRGTKRKRLDGLQHLLDSEVAASRATVGKNNKEDGTEKIV
ncbi:hypothetical protein L195_g052858 [Trifolium pratense]|uniref:Uncharacterized protein n=1 Tax=Trifolium pratense TaxID=57577 RepID=A0A2K3K7G4_TRIPR|nr:hypothetical protein L195_g052858 [Trifolium pratense]